MSGSHDKDFYKKCVPFVFLIIGMKEYRRIGFIESEDKEQCTFCGRKFNNIEDLQTHEIQFHTQRKCHYCEYVAIGLKDMTYHIRDKHPE